MPNRQPASRPIDRLAYPPPLEQLEAEVVTARRAAAHQPGRGDKGLLPADTLGVGVSGGGVRSATFALGVFQAIASAKALGRVDFLSTVSGGGYFGSFLGRLFTRDWVYGVPDVEAAIVGDDTPHAATDAPPATGWGARLFRWLRENGRYLAPRGSGDVLLLGAILLRNWVAVQLVLITTVLTAFVAVQTLRALMEPFWTLHLAAPAGVIWWSPAIVLPLLSFVVMVLPLGWGYWFVSRDRDSLAQLSPRVGALSLLTLALLGAWHYLGKGPFGDGNPHAVRLALCVGVAAVMLLALLQYWRATHTPDPNAGGAQLTGPELDNFARMVLSKRLSVWLQISGILLAVALVDTIGQTMYAVARGHQLAAWSAAVSAAFAGIGAFARPLSVLLGRKSGSERPGLSMSAVSWIAAVVVVSVWLVGIDVASHAVRWGFAVPCGMPIGFEPVTACDAAVQAHTRWFLLATTGVLALFTLIFGRTRIFLNLSSVQGFYAARLIRTYLGASNPSRLEKQTAVSDTMRGDDLASERYWRWPAPTSTTAAPATPSQEPWTKGGPLHIINTTVNETLDVRTGIQNQDRKGTGLAVGPRALSLGIRHHLVSHDNGLQAYPQDGQSRHSVWSATSAEAPEALSLGRWMSISGAAFSAAAGANTTVPIAILCGMFNVRLGYWWDSGMDTTRDPLASRLLPVQYSLFSELLARTRGTAGRLWNLSDGGHFENMAGYELIRRRLPVTVILDAEADPDYLFEGLAGLVRKARLDFKAEIVFVSGHELDGRKADGTAGDGVALLPDEVRPYFGDLEALRRGRWKKESLLDVHGAADTRHALTPDRLRPSTAHAALARVTWGDPRDPDAPRGWLVYVKATLMGDEPEDVLHYHQSHPDFPQETTLDQFFDEAQWESYRRLGQHIGERVLTTSLFDRLQGRTTGS